MNQTFQYYNIDTESVTVGLRICDFLGQVLRESSAIRYSVEILGDTPAQQKYDTRTDRGNTPEHDGYSSRGRGWIQLTGKTNHKLESQEFGRDFINNPNLPAQEQITLRSADPYQNIISHLCISIYDYTR